MVAFPFVVRRVDLIFLLMWDFLGGGRWTLLCGMGDGRGCCGEGSVCGDGLVWVEGEEVYGACVRMFV